MNSLPKWVMAAAVLIAGMQARAVTLPPGTQVQAPSPSVTVSVRTSGTPQGGVATENDPQSLTAYAAGPLTLFGTSSPGAAQPGTATADAAILYGPSPSISAHAVGQPTGLTPPGIQQATGLYYGYNYAGAGVQLYYFLEISGSTPTVNVNVGAMLGASSGPNLADGDGTATFYVQQQGGSYLVNDRVSFNSSFPYGNVNATGDNVIGYNGQYKENGNYTFATGSVYVIGLTARAEVTAYDSATVLLGKQETSVYVDPTFAIASGVADAGSYQFILSQGIGNVANAVPEPSRWSLMFAGLGWLILMAPRGQAGRQPDASQTT